MRHQTLRQGSPYTLQLTKMPKIFTQEAAERQSWQADLEWLQAMPLDGA